MKYNNLRVSRSITNSGLRTMTINKPKYKFVTFTTGEVFTNEFNTNHNYTMFSCIWWAVQSRRRPNVTTSCFKLLRLVTGRTRVTLFRRSVTKKALRDAAPISRIHRIWWKLARRRRYAHNASLLRTPEILVALCANISLSPLNLQAIFHMHSGVTFMISVLISHA
jgi:hypothetical protein